MRSPSSVHPTRSVKRMHNSSPCPYVPIALED
jgi:hypothetical protein